MKAILITATAFLLITTGTAFATDAIPQRDPNTGRYQYPGTGDRFMEDYFPNDYRDRLREESDRFSGLEDDRSYIDRDYYEPEYFPDSGFDDDYGFGYDYDYYDDDSFDYGYDGNNYYGYELNE
jgi:hypothetical protein